MNLCPTAWKPDACFRASRSGWEALMRTNTDKQPCPTSTCSQMSRIPVPRSQSGTFHFPSTATDSHHHGSPLRQEAMSAVSSPLSDTRKKQSKRDEVSTVQLSVLHPTPVGTRLRQYRPGLYRLVTVLPHLATSLLFRSVVLAES